MKKNLLMIDVTLLSLLFLKNNGSKEIAQRNRNILKTGNEKPNTFFHVSSSSDNITKRKNVVVSNRFLLKYSLMNKAIEIAKKG
jgi:hypothetical protein